MISAVFAVILLMVLLVAWTFVMPVLAGLGKYEKRAPKNGSGSANKANKVKTNASSSQYTGYTYEAPDVADEQQQQQQQQQAGSGLKKRITRLGKYTREDIPIQFGIDAPRVAHHDTVARSATPDANGFEFDVDAFIEREHAKDLDSRFDN